MIRIAEYHSDLGNIEVLRAKDTGSFIYRQGGYFQTESDAGGVSVIAYIHAIFGLLSQLHAKDVLMIGCGGGSLGTMLNRAGARVTIVDIVPHAFQIARKYFGLPGDIVCYVGDGRDFLRADHHCYDAIILDAYSGNSIPEHLCDETFFGLAQTRLKKPTGCLIGNVHARHDLDTRPNSIAAKLSKIWTDVRLLDTRGTPNRNALVMAGNVGNLTEPLIMMQPSTGINDITFELERMAFRPWHIPRRVV